MRAGLVDILEAAYTLDGELETWMHKVGETVDRCIGKGLGLIALRYRIGEGFSFTPVSMVPVNMPPEAVAVVQNGTADLPPSYIAQTFASLPCDMARTSGPPEVIKVTAQRFRDYFEPQGWSDCMTVNACDPTGNGLCFGIWLPELGTMTPRMRGRLSRVAAHVAAAHRLRVRVAAGEQRLDAAEAVLSPSGRIEHAEDEAKLREARESLTAGVRALERSRGKLRKTDPDLALAERKALIAARWTLVDRFESDGKHYVVAQRNEALLRGFEALTPREHQALGFAKLGHSNKLIAYEMGIAPSTVSVLLHRAAKKLRTKSREALLAAYVRLASVEDRR
jgi:DNA-binding CsgD family transcriptional regulator